MYRIINEQVRQNCISEIKSLPLEQYQVEIKEIKRSINANNLYWKWVTIIANDLGYNKDELHEAFKRQFIGSEQGQDMFGNVYIRPKSSAKLKKKEFLMYMAKVQAFAHQQNIKLPTGEYYGH